MGLSRYSGIHFVLMAFSVLLNQGVTVVGIWIILSFPSTHALRSMGVGLKAQGKLMPIGNVSTVVPSGAIIGGVIALFS